MIIANASSDLWLNLALGGGAIFGVIAIVVGATFTARYGRRASVSVSAQLFQSHNVFAIIVRPSVKAVGVFKIRFTYARVTVVPLKFDSNAEQLPSEPPAITENVFGDSYVEGGEELLTTIFQPVREPDTSTIGWFARIEVQASPRFLRGRLSTLGTSNNSYWYDTVFVPIVD